MADRDGILASVAQYLSSLAVTPTEIFMYYLLQHEPAIINQNINNTLRALCEDRNTSARTYEWIHKASRTVYSDAVRRLVQKEHGWHFSAVNARAEQIQDFRIEDMTEKMRAFAPELWDLVFHLLSGADAFDEASTMDTSAGLEDDELSEEEYAYWQAIDASEETRSASRKRAGERERRELTVIKTVVIISILLQGRNQHCNALQSTTGLFLHSCNTPEKVIKVLSHMGVSIAPTSIHRAIKSLSRQSALAIRTLGQTRLISLAFDNFDIKFHTLVPTIDAPGDGLVHLTSATMLRLDHGASQQDLLCSDIIWNRQSLTLNPHATDPRPFNPIKTLEFLYTLHPDTKHKSGLTRRGRFNSWFALKILTEDGPSGFHHHRSKLRDPETVEAIPVTKLHQVPLPAMDINPATVSGNIQILEELLHQIGLGDPKEGFTDPGNYTQPTHGDLGTFEHILSVLKQRSEELTPLQRLQLIIFVLGFFHLKLAAADAVWRILVNEGGKGPNIDATSFMKFVGILRPDETGILGSKPKFRQQHELIKHVLTVLILDAWRVEVSKRSGGQYKTLDEFAASQPSLSDLKTIADTIAAEYVAGESETSIFDLRCKPTQERDKQHENIMLMMQYLLLYEELSYAMNAGDIGRVETLFAPWIHIFRATGKHKYGNRMLLYSHNLWFVYPEGLRRILRYNCLVNPTGKPHAFRAVDWVVELLNLYIKDVYGGEGSNYTKNRILMESPLILIYRSSHANFERNFRLSGLSTRHAAKDMKAAFAQLLQYMHTEGPHEFRHGRNAKKILEDMIWRGGEIILAEGERFINGDGQDDVTGFVDGVELEMTAEDLSVEDSMI
ncbi:hypothetical protein EIP86_003604 [Pleurotus ostreatoroseus]|nr:hypothetical protein EIP86_003604 [Pleurotus ostreatoroseus]